MFTLEVGPSGSGKSFLRSQLISAIASNVTPKVFNLDDYRLAVNKNKYPSTAAEHKQINAKAVPKYTEDLQEDHSRLVIIDNTNLRFTPDWQAPLSKCQEQGYHMLPMTPAISECTFVKNRSSHVPDSDTFFRMTHAWPGLKFASCLRKMISPSDIASIPFNSDHFINLAQVCWGSGYLYLLGGYVGYFDESMVRHSIMAGYYMRDSGLEEFFLRKDGMLHITLIPPARQISSEILKKFMKAIVDRHPHPPETTYTGIGIVESNNKTAYFMTLSDESQSAWSQIVEETIRSSKLPLTALTDGFHVTLGCQVADIHNLDKRGPPTIPFTGKWDAKSIQPFSFCFLGNAALTSTGSMEDLRIFLEGNIGGIKRPIEFNLDAIPSMQRKHLAYLISHKNVRSKVRHCPNEIFTSAGIRADIYIVGFRVQGDKKRRIPDDTVYKNDTELIRKVPRGLTYVLQREGSNIKVLSCSYPTSKFFGDNDADHGAVEIASDDELSKAAGSAVQLVLTEKSNGEMFTFAAVRYAENTYVVTIGSKNNKFAFPVTFGQTTQSDVNTMLNTYMKVETPGYSYPPDYTLDKDWTYQNVWLEMCDNFLKLLIKNKKSAQFCEMLSKDGFTACGEYESWLHPHIVQFSKGHHAFKFFALTRHHEDGSPVIDSSIDRVKLLEAVLELEFDAVRVWESEQSDILKLRNDIWHRTNTEGIVALIVRNGNVEAMIKMKTIWYVVHRGIRESLRPWMKQNQSINEEQLNSKLQKKLREKLAIFKIQNQDPLVSRWQRYIKTLAHIIMEYEQNGQQYSLIELYKYKYPSLVAMVEYKMRE